MFSRHGDKEKYLWCQMETNNYIFGLRPVIEAIRAGKEIEKVIVKNNLVGELYGELFAELRKHNITTQRVPAEKLDKITTKNHQGVVAYISPISYQNLEKIATEAVENKKKPLIVILDSLTDVRNFGAIARTCECAGVDAIVVPETNSVRITEDAIKTSAGAMYNIPICKEKNLVDSVLLLQQMGFTVCAATEKTENSLYAQDFDKPIAIIMGSEDLGVSKQLLKRCDAQIRIPMYGKTESLNVSVSTAVIIYEIIRQRNFKN